ncbi:PREDICTED: uncharacterized protein LOC104772790 [Camelina sativa]|uniref:Uncharacterized protein LOC104772790 n=1 Tax=Camelina sativa TaxID=90675 RepID=A0ABM0Y551_CAMSA|nr:PREDICTED: uncharacterized protein LOC104772790 [Camelina sativa]
MGSYCEDVNNNFTESFNKTIDKAREKPFVAMLETVRRLSMVWIAKRSALSHFQKGLCTPCVAKILDKEHEKASECQVYPSTNGCFIVTMDGDKHRVCLQNMTFTCKKYQICGIPCEHVYGVILKRTLSDDDYVCQWFRTAMWRLNYTDGISPQRGARHWPSTLGDNVYVPPEPPQPGRNKLTNIDKKRKPGASQGGRGEVVQGGGLSQSGVGLSQSGGGEVVQGGGGLSQGGGS